MNIVESLPIVKSVIAIDIDLSLAPVEGQVVRAFEIFGDDGAGSQRGVKTIVPVLFGNEIDHPEFPAEPELAGEAVCDLDLVELLAGYTFFSNGLIPKAIEAAARIIMITPCLPLASSTDIPVIVDHDAR